MRSYSQLGQDLVISRFFRCYPPETKFFVDCGAFDGVSFSNTRLLFEQGWRGMCIEPCMKNYKKLELLYGGTAVTTTRAAVADLEGERTLNVATIPGAEEWGSDVSSLCDDTIQRWPNYIWQKEVVQVTTLNRLLEAHSIQVVDFVSIDVEGQELAVLRGLDLGKYHPRLVVMEYSNRQERSEAIRYMESRSYFPWIDNGQDLFMVNGGRLEHLVLSMKYLFTR